AGGDVGRIAPAQDRGRLVDVQGGGGATGGEVALRRVARAQRMVPGRGAGERDGRGAVGQRLSDRGAVIHRERDAAGGRAGGGAHRDRDEAAGVVGHGRRAEGGARRRRIDGQGAGGAGAARGEVGVRRGGMVGGRDRVAAC